MSDQYKVSGMSTFGEWRDSIYTLMDKTTANIGTPATTTCNTNVPASFGMWSCVFNKTAEVIHTLLYDGVSGAIPPVPNITVGFMSAANWVVEINKGWDEFMLLYQQAKIPPEIGQLVSTFDLRLRTKPGIGEWDSPQPSEATMYGALWREETIYPAILGGVADNDKYVWYLRREDTTWCLESNYSPNITTLGAAADGTYYKGVFTSGVISPPITTAGKPFTVRMLYSGNSKYAIEAHAGLGVDPVFSCMFASVKLTDPIHETPVVPGSSNMLQNRLTTDGPFFREARCEGMPEEIDVVEGSGAHRLVGSHPYVASGRVKPFYLVRTHGDHPVVDLYRHAEELLHTKYHNMSTAVHIVFCFEANCKLCGVIIDGEMLGFADAIVTEGTVGKLGQFKTLAALFIDDAGVIEHGTVGGAVEGTPSMGMVNTSLAFGCFAFPYHDLAGAVSSYEAFGLGGTLGAVEIIGHAGAPLEEGDTHMEPAYYMDDSTTARVKNNTVIHDIVDPAKYWKVMENLTARLNEDESYTGADRTALQFRRGHNFTHFYHPGETAAPTMSYNTSIGSAAFYNAANKTKQVIPELRHTQVQNGFLDSAQMYAITSGGMGIDNPNGLVKANVQDTLVGQDYIAFDLDTSKSCMDGVLLRLTPGQAVADPSDNTKTVDPSYEVRLVTEGGYYYDTSTNINWKGVPFTLVWHNLNDSYPYLKSVPLCVVKQNLTSGRAANARIAGRRTRRFDGALLTPYDPDTSDPLPREEHPGGFAMLQVYTHTADKPGTYTAKPTPLYTDPAAAQGVKSYMLPQLHPYKTHRVEIYRYREAATGYQAYRFIVDGAVSEPLYPVQTGSQTIPALQQNVAVRCMCNQPDPTSGEINLWLRNKIQLFNTTQFTGAVVGNIELGIPTVDSEGLLQSVSVLGAYSTEDLQTSKQILNSTPTAMKSLISSLPAGKALTPTWNKYFSNEVAVAGQRVAADPVKTVIQQYKYAPYVPKTSGTPTTVNSWWYTITGGVKTPRYAGYMDYKNKANMIDNYGDLDRWAVDSNGYCILTEVAVYSTTKTWTEPIAPDYLSWAGAVSCYELRGDIEVTITGPSEAGVSFEVHVSFSQAVIGLWEGDFTCTNCVVEFMAGADADYVLEVSPTQGGDMSIKLPAAVNSVEGKYGGFMTLESNTLQITLVARATPTITAPSFSSTAFAVDIMFSEDVVGLTLSDFTTSNCTLSNLSGSGSYYNCLCTPDGGDMSLFLNAGAVSAVSDAAQNPMSNICIIKEATAPVPTMTGPTSVDVGAAFTVNVDFTTLVTGLEISDFTITNGAIEGLTGAGANYVLSCRATGAAASTITITLAADTVSDTYTGVANEVGDTIDTDIGADVAEPYIVGYFEDEECTTTLDMICSSSPITTAYVQFNVEVDLQASMFIDDASYPDYGSEVSSVDSVGDGVYEIVVQGGDEGTCVIHYDGTAENANGVSGGEDWTEVYGRNGC